MILIVIILLVNIISSGIYERFDLTKEGRYTLSEATKEILNELNDIVYVKVYLEGEFPAGFKRLRNETMIMLDEMRSYADGKIEYEFIDPFTTKDQKQKKEIYNQLIEKGLSPTNLQIQEDDYSEKIIFPGAVFSYKSKELPLELLQNQVGLSPQENLNNSITSLEYGIASIIRKLQLDKKQKIALIEGHGELEEIEVTDLVRSLSPYYDFSLIDLPNYIAIPQIFSLAIIAKPTSSFSEKDKFKIDQYIMNGGRVLWLIESLSAEMDSFKNGNLSFIAFPMSPCL